MGRSAGAAGLSRVNSRALWRAPVRAAPSSMSPVARIASTRSLQAVDLGHSIMVAQFAPWDRDPDGRKPLAGSGEPKRARSPAPRHAGGAHLHSQRKLCMLCCASPNGLLACDAGRPEFGDALGLLENDAGIVGIRRAAESPHQVGPCRSVTRPPFVTCDAAGRLECCSVTATVINPARALKLPVSASPGCDGSSVATGKMEIQHEAFCTCRTCRGALSAPAYGSQLRERTTRILG